MANYHSRDYLFGSNRHCGILRPHSRSKSGYVYAILGAVGAGLAISTIFEILGIWEKIAGWIG